MPFQEFYSESCDDAGNIIERDGKPVSRALSDLYRFDRRNAFAYAGQGPSERLRAELAAERARLIAVIDSEARSPG